MPNYEHFEAGCNGTPIPDLCKEHGMSNATLYKWRAKDGGVYASMMVRLTKLERENSRLMKMYVESQMMADVLRELLKKK